MYNKIYTVFVGGVEVNDYYVDLKTANKIMLRYLEKGYTDVAIVKCKDICKNKQTK